MKNEWQILAEKLLFDFGKAVLGKNGGGQIVKLLRAKGIDGARNAIKAASEKENPAEYIVGAIRQDEIGRPTIIDHDAIARKHGYHWNGDKYVKMEGQAK